jgi:hypothetical protein
MTKIKNIFIFLFILVFIYSCGFKPIYSTNNLNLKLDNINFETNKLNNQINRSLRSFSSPQGSKIYDVNFETKKEKRVVTKNSKGNTETYEIKINLNMSIVTEGKKFTKNFVHKVKYNNNDNKYELKQYEIEIEKQIITELIEEIILFFSEI